MIGRCVDEEGCDVVDVDAIEKGSDIGTYNVDADNGVTLKSGDINTTLEAGDICATYEGGDGR